MVRDGIVDGENVTTHNKSRFALCLCDILSHMRPPLHTTPKSPSSNIAPNLFTLCFYLYEQKSGVRHKFCIDAAFLLNTVNSAQCAEIQWSSSLFDDILLTDPRSQLDDFQPLWRHIHHSQIRNDAIDHTNTCER